MSRVIKDIKLPNKEFSELKCNKICKRYFIDMPYSHFLDLIESFAIRILKYRNETKPFRFLKHQEQILKIFYCYMRGDEQFYELVPDQTVYMDKKKRLLKPDIMKGIMLHGPVGCGKTLLMEAFLEIYNYVILEEPFLRIDAEEWDTQIADKSITYFKYRPLFINDFYKEVDESKVWGKPIYPARSTIGLRGETGAWTMATSNCKFDLFDKRYGEYISSRMIQLLNFVEIIGPNLRK